VFVRVAIVDSKWVSFDPGLADWLDRPAIAGVLHGADARRLGGNPSLTKNSAISDGPEVTVWGALSHRLRNGRLHNLWCPRSFDRLGVGRRAG
jgi:hypothetical protein